MNRTATRSMIAAIAGPILATGFFFAGAPAQATAAPGDSTCSNSMAMAQTKAATGAPSVMTRAGQVAASTPAPNADGAMASGCSTASHG